jgi:hypothetical protein
VLFGFGTIKQNNGKTEYCHECNRKQSKLISKNVKSVLAVGRPFSIVWYEGFHFLSSSRRMRMRHPLLRKQFFAWLVYGSSRANMQGWLALILSSSSKPQNIP